MHHHITIAKLGQIYKPLRSVLTPVQEAIMMVVHSWDPDIS